MAKVKYGVELIRQEQNPICWVASCAMVKGYGTKTSVGVGDFTGGFDPSNSSIPNLANSWSGCTDAMTKWGFDVQAVGDQSSGQVTADSLLSLLQNGGPMVLLHLCSGFPYGSQWGTQTFKATDAHAVVITGVDTDTSTATFNNPWGDRDQSCSLTTLLQHINSDKSMGKTLGFWSAKSTDSSSNQSTGSSSSSQSPGQNADDSSGQNSSGQTTSGSSSQSTDGSSSQSTDGSSNTDNSSQNTDNSSGQNTANSSSQNTDEGSSSQ